MRLPRPRFTLRWLMIAVAVAGVFLGVRAWCEGRSARFREIADRHWRLWLENPASVVDSRIPDEAQVRRSEYDRAMREKYLRASRRPWLAVEPDEAEPIP